MQRVIKIKEVSARSAKSKSAIYDDVAKGKFPKPIKIGARASGWLESEVEAWLEKRISERGEV